MKHLIPKLKTSLLIDINFFLCIGIFLIVLAGIGYTLGNQKLSEQLVIYAYFALLIGILAQIWELKFRTDPIVWILQRVQSVKGITHVYKRERILLFLLAILLIYNLNTLALIQVSLTIWLLGGGLLILLNL